MLEKPMFSGMGNHLGLFSEASDQPEGHRKGGGAEGGQEAVICQHLSTCKQNNI